jgi:diaminopimelate epimerase
MAGAGNDFIVIDAAPGLNYKNLARKACDRTNGIGADGLLVLDRSRRADYKMRIINADGSEAEMCGNGARCMAAYIVRHKRPSKKLFKIETLAGQVLGSAKGEKAAIQLSALVDYAPNIPIIVHGRAMRVSSIDTGVPHVVVCVEGLNNIDVPSIGREIRSHERFQPRGTNVNFVEEAGRGMIHVRTYERGVEDETKACGTGSVAAAIVTFLQNNPGVTGKKAAGMSVRTAGGEILKVTFDVLEGKVKNVWLTGSARFIAKGEYYV